MKSESLLRQRKRKLRKRTVDRVVETCFWDAFWDGLNGTSPGLEYASTSGLYEYNGVRRIAEKAGYEFAQRVIAAHVNPDGRHPFGHRFKREIPGAVYAECYGEARIA